MPWPSFLKAWGIWIRIAASAAAQEGHRRRQLEETLRRAAVACYAAQGAYPPDLSYIEEHWGVQIDRSRYAVFYQVEGSNLMPDITVLERET